MTARSKIAVGATLIVAPVLAENFFGRQLNAFFLRAPGIDKGLHVLAFFLIFVAVYWLAGHVSRNARALLALGTGVALSLADELLQQFAPGRSVEFYDLVADWAGLSFGWVAARGPRRPIGVAVAALALLSTVYVSYDTHVKLIDYSRALHFEAAHDFVAAREHYVRAVAKGNRSAAIYNGLAWASIESGTANPEEAVEYAARALAMTPDDPNVLDTYGWALHHVGHHSEARNYLLRAQTMRPDLFCIHYHLGQVYLALAQPDVARDHFSKQMRIRGTREAVLAERALKALDGDVVTSIVPSHEDR